MIGEIWRVVPSFQQFLVSSEGRIMVAPHLEDMPHGGTRQYGGQPTFGVWNKQDGRFIIVHKQKTYKVASLVCEAFKGFKPSPELVCMHRDENAANNRPDNLEWGTQKENLNAPGFVAYCQERTGENSPAVKGRARKKQEVPDAPDIPDEPKAAEKLPEALPIEEVYARFVRAMRNADSLATLGEVWKLRQSDLKTLPGNWQAELTAEKDRIKVQLQTEKAA